MAKSAEGRARTLKGRVQAYERRLIKVALERAGGNQHRAALALGVRPPHSTRSSNGSGSASCATSSISSDRTPRTPVWQGGRPGSCPRPSARPYWPPCTGMPAPEPAFLATRAARDRARFGLFLLLLSVAATQAGAQANFPLDSFWVTDGAVYGITESGGTVYLGGAFNYVGPRTGNLVRLDAATGAPDLALPEGRGPRLLPSRSDGAGGWFIGGVFVERRGRATPLLAHVLADGSVSSWNPNPPSTARSDAWPCRGRSVYAGGSFSTIGGQTRSNIAAIDAASGLATSWNPNANNAVDEILVAGNLVYAGGSFTNIGGLAKFRLAALDAATGSATTWSPNVNGSIAAMALSGTTMYVGGSFSMIGVQTRNNIGAVSTLTGAPTAWNPNANSIVQSLRLQGTTLYAGGIFSSIGGAVRNNIAALDTTVDTNNATAWNPNANFGVTALAVSGTTLYAGGDFTTIGGQPRLRLAALDTTVNTNNATAWNPSANSTVDVIQPDGASVYVGGGLSSAGGQLRGRIAALDADDGRAHGLEPGRRR